MAAPTSRTGAFAASTSTTTSATYQSVLSTSCPAASTPSNNAIHPPCCSSISPPRHISSGLHCRRVSSRQTLSRPRPSARSIPSFSSSSFCFSYFYSQSKCSRQQQQRQPQTLPVLHVPSSSSLSSSSSSSLCDLYNVIGSSCGAFSPSSIASSVPLCTQIPRSEGNPQQRQHQRKRRAIPAYLGLLLASASSLTIVVSAPQQDPASPAASPASSSGNNPQPLAAPGNPSPSPGNTKPTPQPTNTQVPSTKPTTADGGGVTIPPPQSIITVGPIPQVTTMTTTTTTTTAKTFSNNVITVGVPSSAGTKPTNTPGNNLNPSATPYGVISDDNSNGSLMLIVSLVVVFVVLAGMGLVVFCLFRRRSAKRRLHLFGKGGPNSTSSSTSKFDNMLAAAGQRRASIKSLGGSEGLGSPRGLDSKRRASEIDTSRTLQEMTEQHQSTLLSRRSSTLSMGSGLHSQAAGHVQGGGSRPDSRILSPVLGPSRPFSQTSGHWSGSNVGSSGIVVGSGDYIPAPMEPSRDFRNSQYDEYYGAANPSQRTSQQLVYPNAHFAGRAGSSDYSSNEQLLIPTVPGMNNNSGSPSLNNLSRRSSLSPGLYPQTEQFQGPSTLFRAKTVSIGSMNVYQPPPTRGSIGYGISPSPNHGPYYGLPSLGRPFLTDSSSIPTMVSSFEDLTDSERTRSTPESPGAAASSGGTVEGEHTLIRPKSMSMLQGSPAPHAPYGPMNPNASSSGNLVEGDGSMRPHSMMTLGGSSSNLVIPPSITTRPRSMLNVNGMFHSQGQMQVHGQGQGQSPYQYQPRPHSPYDQPHQFQQPPQQQQPGYFSPAPPPPVASRESYGNNAGYYPYPTVSGYSEPPQIISREFVMDDDHSAAGVGSGSGSGSGPVEGQSRRPSGSVTPPEARAVAL